MDVDSLSKLAAGVHYAATHASQDGDLAKSAKLVAMSLHLVFDDIRLNSHMYWRTVGQIGTKALNSNVVDGRSGLEVIVAKDAVQGIEQLVLSLSVPSAASKLALRIHLAKSPEARAIAVV